MSISTMRHRRVSLSMFKLHPASCVRDTFYIDRFKRPKNAHSGAVIDKDTGRIRNSLRLYA